MIRDDPDRYNLEKDALRGSRALREAIFRAYGFRLTEQAFLPRETMRERLG